MLDGLPDWATIAVIGVTIFGGFVAIAMVSRLFDHRYPYNTQIGAIFLVLGAIGLIGYPILLHSLSHNKDITFFGTIVLLAATFGAGLGIGDAEDRNQQGADNRKKYKELEAYKAQQRDMLDSYTASPADSPLSSPHIHIPIPDHVSREQEQLQELCHSCCALFPGLKEPNVAITSSPHPDGRPAWAWCDGTTLTITTGYLVSNPSPCDLIAVIKHELVHAWIIQNEYPDNDRHGQLFQAKAREIGAA